jgi:hypothetical protein
MEGKELTRIVREEGIHITNYKGEPMIIKGDDAFRDIGEGGFSLTPDGPKFEPVKNEREDEYWVVVLKCEDQYFEVRGDYNSWDGVYWDYAEFIEVKPVEVTTIEYVSV